MISTKTTYQAKNLASGPCGHRHRTAKAAARCGYRTSRGLVLDSEGRRYTVVTETLLSGRSEICAIDQETGAYAE